MFSFITHMLAHFIWLPKNMSLLQYLIHFKLTTQIISLNLSLFFIIFVVFIPSLVVFCLHVLLRRASAAFQDPKPQRQRTSPVLMGPGNTKNCTVADKFTFSALLAPGALDKLCLIIQLFHTFTENELKKCRTVIVPVFTWSDDTC